MTRRPSTTSSTARGLGAEHRRNRLLVLERDGYRCQMRTSPRCTGVATTAQHVIARSAGGRATLDNMIAACAPCNYGEGPALAAAARRPAFFRRAWSRDRAPRVSLPGTSPSDEV